MEKGLRMYGGLDEGVKEVGRNEPLNYWSDHISISRKHFMETVERSDEYQQMFEDMLKQCNEGLKRERELEKQLRNEKQLVMKLQDDIERKDTRIADLNENLAKKEKEYSEMYTMSVVNSMLRACTTGMKAKYDGKCRENADLEMNNQLLSANEERLKEDLKLCQLEKKKIEGNFSDLQQEKEIADKENKHLTLQQEELKRESRSWELKYTDENDLYKKLYLENVLARHKLSKVEDENLLLKEQLTEFKEELKIIRKDLEIAKETVKKERATAFNLEMQNKNLINLLSDHESRNGKLNNDLTKAREQNSNLQITNHEITEMNNKVCDLKENLQRNLIGQQKKYDILKNEI